MVSKSHNRFYFVQDGDAGLSKAFLAAFAREVSAGLVDFATVAFDKYQVNDVREVLYAQGRRQLREDLGLSAQQLNCLPLFALNEELDREICKTPRRTCNRHAVRVAVSYEIRAISGRGS